MGLLHRLVAGHREMQVHVVLGTRTPRPQLMDLDPLGGALGLEVPRQLREQLEVRLIQQTDQRSPDHTPAGTQDVGRHQQRHDRVQDVDTRVVDRRQREQRAGRRRHVRQDVDAVGLDGLGTLAATDPQQVEAQAQVPQAGDGRDHDAGAELTELAAGGEVPHRRKDDDRGRSHDHRALDGGRERLGLAVSVGVVAVRRACGHRHAVGDHRRRDHVDDGLGGIGQQHR